MAKKAADYIIVSNSQKGVAAIMDKEDFANEVENPDLRIITTAELYTIVDMMVMAQIKKNGMGFVFDSMLAKGWKITVTAIPEKQFKEAEKRKMIRLKEPQNPE